MLPTLLPSQTTVALHRIFLAVGPTISRLRISKDYKKLSESKASLVCNLHINLKCEMSTFAFLIVDGSS